MLCSQKQQAPSHDWFCGVTRDQYQPLLRLDTGLQDALDQDRTNLSSSALPAGTGTCMTSLNRLLIISSLRTRLRQKQRQGGARLHAFFSKILSKPFSKSQLVLLSKDDFQSILNHKCISTLGMGALCFKIKYLPHVATIWRILPNDRKKYSVDFNTASFQYWPGS